MRAEARILFANTVVPMLLGFIQIPKDIFEAVEEISVLCVFFSWP